ncbi:MAG: 2-oxo acid dehydrogenase subunit E2 [Burkholderiales bacterium]|nr:2-oxo acid dehydrogenase subunit E2 [Burkholderiales bacterium]
MIEFKLPSLGADMDEGKLLEWKVKPGDTVRRGDVVAIVDTSKAAVDIEIWEAGIVDALVVAPGQTVPVGTVLAILRAPGEAPGAPRAPGAPAAAAPAAAPGAAPGAAPSAAPASSPAAAPAAAAPPPGPGGAADGARRRASPAARKRAGELGIDLAALRGSGPDGAITLDDVEAAARAPRPATGADRAGEMRRAMAAAMSRSKREIPHYYLGQTVNLARASAWLEARNAHRPITERLIMAALVTRAVALACTRHPAMNGFFRDGAFAPSAAVHVGVAIALRGGGLVAPAILDADRKSAAEVMTALSDLVRRSRAGSLRSSEMANPTITLTNLGELGSESVFGVIYPPQVALVGFGAIADRPWVDNGTVVAAPCATATLSGDHRVSSGHQGALFLAEITSLLQQPEAL